MAGGKIFLEPILQNTVVDPIHSINDAIAPLPAKIDEQIKALENVAELVGSSASIVNIIAGYKNEYDAADLSGISVPKSGGSIATFDFYAGSKTNGRTYVYIPALSIHFKQISESVTTARSVSLSITDVTTSTSVYSKTLISFNQGAVQDKDYTGTASEGIFDVIEAHQYRIALSATTLAGTAVSYSNLHLIDAADNYIKLLYDFSNPIKDGAFTK